MMGQEKSEAEHRESVILMRAAHEGLVRHRRGTPWPTIVGSCSLLEQSLKLLVGIRKPDYLPSGGKKDRHNLGVVYDKLEEEDKDSLEEMDESYAQYASFIKFPSEFGTLREYLDVIGDRQVDWRYFLLDRDGSNPPSPRPDRRRRKAHPSLLDRDGSNPSSLPSPDMLDMLLEAIRSVLDILERTVWHDDEMQMHDVCQRLAEGLEVALHHARMSDGPSHDDLNGWARDGRGVVNAFSRYLRAGPLDDYPDAMRKWLDHAVEAARAAGKAAEQDGDDDLARFLRVASRCCATVNDNRFSFTNHRPEPLFGGQSLDLPLRLRDGWSVEWRTDKTTWCGAVDAIRELPVRVGQISTMRWRRCRKPSQTDFVENTQGQLTVRRHEHELMSLNVRILTARPRGPKGTRVDHALFVVVDAGGNWPSEECDLACQACRGTGFCMDCRGESTEPECQTCSAEGLCPQCRGYGRDGDHIIAGTARSS